MTSIQETVNEAMNRNGMSGYIGQAQPVVRALTEREQGIADTLVRFATEQGLSRADAIAACEEAGLMFSGTPDATPSPDLMTAVEELRAQVRQINDSLDNITRINR